jgi:hypothetical protein
MSYITSNREKLTLLLKRCVLQKHNFCGEYDGLLVRDKTNSRPYPVVLSPPLVSATSASNDKLKK